MKMKGKLISLINGIFILLVGMVLVAGCSSIPVAPPLEPLPPGAASLRLRIGTADGANNEGKVGGGGTTIEQELLPALASVLKTAGFQLVYDPRAADASVNVAVGFHGTSFVPYRTTLTLRGPQGTQIDQVQFVGGVGSDYQGIAHGIAFNLVDKLLKSPIFIAFAQEPRAKPTSTASEKSVIKSDVDELPAIKAKSNKNSYAIVIGIENYRQKLPKADYAVNDAKTMTEYLTKVMGYPEENVVTLLNEHATNVDFAKYFEKWLWNNVEKDGSVFIYYSGHGAPNPKTGDAYLVPYDGDPSFIDETGYSLKRLYESLGKLQAKEIIVALDSCFSGAGGRSVLAKGARPLVMTMEKSAIPSNTAVLSAASGEQISSTYEEKGHGLFTYFMLKGLKGEGDANGDGKVEIGELFEYIKPQVERIARKVYNNEQLPQLIAPAETIRQKLIER